jgi:glutamate-1-semialdehyde 2,1-aminomutase
MTTSRPSIEQEYAAARPRSRALSERARAVMPSGAAHDGRVFAPFPFYVERADGARKWDVDGHVYIDCWSGHGALMLGHNHPAVVKAITEQARKGLHYSAGSEIEVRWAELIRSIVPGADRVRFTLTGTETTSLAVRVARAFTGRDHIFVAAVKDPFEIPASAGVPASTLKMTLVARCNDIAHVRELLDEHPVAAIILEPAGGRSMTVPTNPAFLKALREETTRRGVVLIFDEVVTGFRVALVGRADLMDSIAFSGDAKRDRTKRVADQGTYSGTPLVAAAAVAQLEILKTGEVQRELNRLGDRLRAGMNQTLKTRGVRGCVYGASSVFRIFLGADAAELGLDNWTADAARLDRGMGPISGPLHLAMLINGVDYSRGNAHGWLNGALTDQDVDQIIDAFERSILRLQEERLLG